MGQPVPPEDGGAVPPEDGDDGAPADGDDGAPDGGDAGPPGRVVAAAAPWPVPGSTPTPTSLLAALQDTPAASAGLTATCTSSMASLDVLPGRPMLSTTALKLSTLLAGRGHRPPLSLVAKISTWFPICSPSGS
jgi:hypothetical protein